jgi:hypothetical protein
MIHPSVSRSLAYGLPLPRLGMGNGNIDIQQKQMLFSGYLLPIQISLFKFFYHSNSILPSNTPHKKNQ